MNGLIRWFADNHVAANLLMVSIMALGVISARSIKQEVFPEIDMDIITVSVPYLGATPSEVEEAVCVRVEEQIQGVDGIKKITSTASEGVGTVAAELDRGADKRKALDDIKAEVDRIITFPEETEKPIINLVERKQQVIDLVIYGDASERALKILAEQVRDDLLATNQISYATLGGTRPFEISIEVSEANLRAFGLTLSQVTQAVRANSLDLPGGSVKTDAGEVLVRTKGQRYTGEEFAKIVVITAPDGTQVPLDQIATIRDGFEDVDLATYLNGKPAAMVSVFRTGRQGVLNVTDLVKQYVQEKKEQMPPGVELTTWYDRSEIYSSRMDLLLKNGAVGLLLVFLCLALALEIRLALWVSLGIAISFLGAFWVVPMFGVSLNMISMFAFIVSLGLVVDDAIVVGENIYAHREMGRKAQKGATLGALEVSGPVTFAVLTTVMAFLPLAFVDGVMGKFMFNIPVVVIAVLLFSLVESLLIPPAHLATIKQVAIAGTEQAAQRGFGWYVRFKASFDDLMKNFVAGTYQKNLRFALANRGLVLAIATAVMLLTFGWFAGGHIKFTMMPDVDADNIVASLTLPQGTTIEEATKASKQLENSMASMVAEYESNRSADAPSIVKNVSTTIGAHLFANQRNPMGGQGPTGAHLVEVNAELLAAEDRNIPSGEMAQRWREICGPVTGAVALTILSNLFHGGNPIYVQLASPHPEDLIAAGRRLKEELATYPGVMDIADSFREGKMEMKLSLKPEARTLGLTLNDLAGQVRAGFYGDEAMRIQRGRDEVKVMIRYPEEERRSVGNIESMRIRTPQGSEVPFSRVAIVEIGRGYATVERANRQRIVNVTAEIDQSIANADELNNNLRHTIMPQLMSDFPGLRYSMEGQQKDQAESMSSLGTGFMMALLMIYVLLAVLFKSYSQPILVMTAIPFGLVGAIGGHVLMGMDLTILSVFGIVALTGVVVNDSLIMIDFINRSRRSGLSLNEAVIKAGQRRFRPIMLTSITTFAGLSPLLLERSLQARFLIPMAASLGFGVIFATLITLMLVPVSYTVLADAKQMMGLEVANHLDEEDEEDLADLRTQ